MKNIISIFFFLWIDNNNMCLGYRMVVISHFFVKEFKWWLLEKIVIPNEISITHDTYFEIRNYNWITCFMF